MCAFSRVFCAGAAEGSVGGGQKGGGVARNLRFLGSVFDSFWHEICRKLLRNASEKMCVFGNAFSSDFGAFQTSKIHQKSTRIAPESRPGAKKSIFPKKFDLKFFFAQVDFFVDREIN